MSIKFNWGTGIFIFIVLFILSMVAVIVFSFNQKVNLVTPEYYPKGVKHEDHINKIKNTALLEKKIGYTINEQILSIQFPDEFLGKKIEGSIQFYYVADFEKDHTFELRLDNKLKQEFQTASMATGRYILKIDWKDEQKAYFQEIDVSL